MHHSSSKNFPKYYFVVMLFALVILTMAQPAWPKEDSPGNEESHRLSSMERSTFKTVTFQTTANLADALIFGSIVGATATTSALFFLANTASGMAVYFPYELTWNVFGPSQETTTEKTIAIKTVSYQIISGIRNLALSYAFSGALWASAGFMTAAIAVDSVIYVANEYLWDILSPRIMKDDRELRKQPEVKN
ncbi:membrane hypothetical protein [Gammaproteobacteria bacterium]